MNKQETAQVITLLAGNYESIANKSKLQMEMMLNTWQECLGDLDYKLVLHAVKKSIIESPYPPTIHDIRKNAIETIKPTTQRSGIEAWQEAYKMICCGTYMTEEDFNTYSPEVKKFFGNVKNLQSYSTNEDFNVDVCRSNFLKQYDIIIEREKEHKMLPEKMKDIIEKLAEKMDIKQLDK